MAEPEDLLIDAAHFASRRAAALWRRHRPSQERPVILLADVRVRIELFLHAVLGRPVAVSAAEPAAPVSWLARLARVAPAGEPRIRPATDGRRVYLPPVMDAAAGRERALGQYLMLAAGQALRLQRGSAAGALALPERARARFLLAEAAAVDQWMACALPGLREPLVAARREALAAHGGTDSPVVPPGSVHALVRGFLAGQPDAPPAEIPACPVVEVSMAWAAGVCDGDPDARRAGPPRPAALPYYWGIPRPAASAAAGGLPGTNDAPEGRDDRRRRRVAEMRRRPRMREALENEDDEGTGTWVIRADEPQESIEDPFGLQRPADHADAADPEGLGDSLSELPDARVVRTPGLAREVLRSGDPLDPATRQDADLRRPGGIIYPEWDSVTAQYRACGAVVREMAAAPGDPVWAAAALARHGALVRRVRSRFERLRPGLTIVNRQPDGSAIDIAACVSASADARAGGIVDDRLYLQMRPVRRALSVALLVDISASTDSWVSGGHRIVDVEKEALLVVTTALDALRDRYAIFAFRGEGPDQVSVVPIKRFAEAGGAAVRLRIAGLEADGYTRSGAAVRHAAAELERDGGRQRLLIVLSDGKPNDVDRYAGVYGIEDTRMAVAEARRRRTDVFCLTVDREAPLYAPRIFGRRGFALLRRPDQLPAVLVDVLRRLIRP